MCVRLGVGASSPSPPRASSTKRLVLDARAGRARDDVEPSSSKTGHRAEAAGGDVARGSAGRPRSPRACAGWAGSGRRGCVSPMPRDRSCSKATRVLMMPSGGMPASVTPRCSGTSGRTRGEARVGLDDLARVRVLERDDVARRSRGRRAARSARAPTRPSAATSSSGWRAFSLGVDGAAVDADAQRAVVLAAPRRPGSATFSRDRLVLLVVVEVAGVVADLVDVGRDLRGQAVVLLEVDRRGWPSVCRADLRQRLDVLRRCRRRCARRRRPASADRLGLLDRGVDVLRAWWRTCSARRRGGRRPESRPCPPSPRASRSSSSASIVAEASASPRVSGSQRLQRADAVPHATAR